MANDPVKNGSTYIKTQFRVVGATRFINLRVKKYFLYIYIMFLNCPNYPNIALNIFKRNI